MTNCFVFGNSTLIPVKSSLKRQTGSRTSRRLCELLDVTFLSIASSSLAFKTLCCFVSSLPLFLFNQNVQPCEILYTKHDSFVATTFIKKIIILLLRVFVNFGTYSMYATFMPGVQTG